MPRYKTLRVRQEDYEKLREVAHLLKRKGTESIDWDELRGQDVVEVPGEGEDVEAQDFTWGFIIGLGAAALAYLLLKQS